MLEKSFFRKKCLRLRRDLDTEVISHRISLQILSFFKSYPVDSIGFYYPIQREPDLREALLKLQRQKIIRNLALPRICGTRMSFLLWDEHSGLVKDDAGIPAPVGKEIIHPQCLLIPCVGIDWQGYRLGYGGGWYDRLLKKGAYEMTVGVVAKPFVLKELPHEAHDVPLDGFVNEDGFTWVKPLQKS